MIISTIESAVEYLISDWNYAVIIAALFITVPVLIFLFRRKAYHNKEESKHSKEEEPSLVIAVKMVDFAEMMSLYGSGVLDEIIRALTSKLRTILYDLNNKSEVEYARGGIVFVKVYGNVADPKYIAYRVASEIGEIEVDFFGMKLAVRTAVGLGIGENSYDEAVAAAEVASRESKPLIDFKELALDIDRNVKIANMRKKYDELREALRSGNIVPVFQPIFHSRMRSVEKFEALGRIRMPNGEMRPIAMYMDVLRNSSLMEECVIDLFDKVFSVAKNIPYSVSFNLDLNDIKSKIIVDFIMYKIESDPATARKIIFEILETEGHIEMDIVRDFCQRVRSFGVNIAIDDFGTGYSNFGRILELQPMYLKIDGSIISRILDDKVALAEAKAIVSFCKEVGLESVAEFVSNALIYKKVLELGIDYCQGYLFSPPITYEELQKKYLHR